MCRGVTGAIISLQKTRPLYGATHLFGSHSKLLLKAPICCYASFWKALSASFEGPYMVLRIFLEAILSFF
jgi:hypothetical protein